MRNQVTLPPFGHGQKMCGVAEGILRDVGHELAPFDQAHLCCGSAGAYSLLQPDLSRALRGRKLAWITQAAPEVIATANIGCQAPLAAGTATLVPHWITLLS